MIAFGIWSITSGLPKPAFGLSEPQSLVVLFDFDSSELTKYGQRDLDHFASGAKKLEPMPKILVSCHTDRAGTQDYNLALSKRRCATVRDTLARAGIAPQLIVLWPRGEDAIAVPTPDGIEEPGNRFAVIDYCDAFDDRPRSCD
jgi:outer membrane protein OmpA-like peptidoglycan-associated protein